MFTLSRIKAYRNLTPEECAGARQRIITPSKPSGSYYLLVCLSATIATLGLLANSTAVVIGAMLVAPLMGPIFGIALALSIGDRRLLKTAVFAELAGIFLATALPVLIGLIPLRPDFGSEILARTQPNVYDVIIALASGLAGAYALVDPKISPALPGVAIATALVPPLAACGLNIAAADWHLASGAFLLFVINFIAIEFAAAIVFMIMGLTEMKVSENGSHMKAVTKRLGISFVILVLAGIFMTQTLITMVKDKNLDNSIRLALNTRLANYAGARLSSVVLNNESDQIQVIATIITPQEFDSLRVANLEENLQTQVNPHIRLIVRSVMSRDADKLGPVFIASEELEHRKKDTQEAEFMNNVTKVLSERIKSVAGAQIIDVTKDMVEDMPQITVSVRTPRVITPTEVEKLEEYLHEEVNDSLKLVVRSILTKDADSTRYIYDPDDPMAKLEEEELELYQRLLNEISWYLSQEYSGASVSELNFEEKADKLQVRVSIYTPTTWSPPQVEALQKYLWETVDPRILITVHSIVGGTTTAESYTVWSE